MSIFLSIFKLEGPIQEVGYWVTAIPIEFTLLILSFAYLKHVFWPNIDLKKEYQKSVKEFRNYILVLKSIEERNSSDSSSDSENSLNVEIEVDSD